MAAGKEEKKEEKKDEKEKVKEEMITAIYKVNLHCPECGRKIKRHLLVTQGVHTVEMDIEKGEIKAKGKLDPLKILKIIQTKSKKKVELISPKIKPKDATPPADKKPKEIKEAIIRTLKVKVHMHCDKCERDLRSRLIKHKGIFSVKTDQKAQTVTIEGSIEPEKLLSFMKRRVHKNAEIISSKEEKKDDEKEKGKKDGKSPEEKKEGKPGESGKEKGEGKSSGESTKEKEKEKEKEKGEGKSSGETKIKEIQRDAKVEIMAKDNVPYIIHYVYAPQLFSDENPNACSIS